MRGWGRAQFLWHVRYVTTLKVAWAVDTVGWVSRMIHSVVCFFLKICCVSIHTKTWYAMIWSIIVVSALRWPPATAWVTMEQRSRDGTASTLCWSLTQSFYNTSGKNSAAKFNHWQRYVLSSLKGESLISWVYILVNSNIFSHRCAFNIFVSRFQNSGCVWVWGDSKKGVWQSQPQFISTCFFFYSSG